MAHVLNDLCAKAWNAIKLPGQPDYGSLGIDYRGTLYGWAEYALSGQPIKDGDHPGAKFKRKVVELNGQAFIDANEISDDDPYLFIPGLPIQKIPVTIEGDKVRVPAFELPSTTEPEQTERRVGLLTRRVAGQHLNFRYYPNSERRFGVADRRGSHTDIAAGDPIVDLSSPNVPEPASHGLDHEDEAGGTPV